MVGFYKGELVTASRLEAVLKISEKELQRMWRHQRQLGIWINEQDA